MQYLFPTAAFGLLTLPIIILLHLLRQRRLQRPIPSLALWRGLERKQTGNRFQSIPLTLLLILQLCVAIGLVFALSQPVTSYDLSQPRQVIALVDLTTSMLATDVAPEYQTVARTRFEAAQYLLREQINSLQPNDQLILIGLSPNPDLLFQGGGAQQEQLLSAIDNLVAGATGLDFDAALTLAMSHIDPDRQTELFVISDGHFINTPDPQNIPLTWQIVAGSAVANQALVNVSAQRLPDQTSRIFARVVNYGATAAQRTVVLRVDGEAFDRQTINLTANGEQALVWTIPARRQTAEVVLLEPDALALDNQAGLWLDRTAQRNVLLVSPDPDILARALTVNPSVNLVIDEAVANDPSQWTAFDLIVLEGFSLSDNRPPGRYLLIDPIVEESIRNYRPEPSSAALWLNGVDLSGVYFNLVRQPNDWLSSDWLTVELTGTPLNPYAVLDDAPSPPTSPDIGDVPLVLYGDDGSQQLIVWLFSLKNRQTDSLETNLPARLAFPLLVDSTLNRLINPLPDPVQPIGQSVTLVGEVSIELPDGRRLRQASQQTEHDFSHTKQVGLYKLYQQEELLGGFAVHAGSPLESNLQNITRPDENATVPIAALSTLPPETRFTEWWSWLAVSALLILLVETWLVWRG